MDIPAMSLDRLRTAIRIRQISFPSQVPVFCCQPRPDVQWRLAELFFVHRWACTDLARRYKLSVGYVRQLILRWARRAAALGYLQEIPASEAPIAPRVRGRAVPSSSPRQTTRLRRICFEVGVIDLDAHVIRAAGSDVPLTSTEFWILEKLALQVNQTVPRYELVKLLEDSQAPKGVHSLRHFIRNLRQKLEPESRETTIPGY
jgi:hypothetical protein